MELREVPVEQIAPPSLSPRWEISPESVAELAASIAEQGLIQPITVAVIDDGYRLVAGNRRLHACRDLLGWDTIPALVVSDQVDEPASTIVENLQRKDLDPIEEALMYGQVLEATGQTQAELAKRIGVSRSYIAKRLMLTDLDEATLRAIIKGEISWTHGLELRRLEDLDKRGYYLGLCINSGVQVRVLQAWIDEALRSPTPPPRDGEEARDVPQLQPYEPDPMRCLMCGHTEHERVLTFVPMCLADKFELERLLKEAQNA